MSEWQEFTSLTVTELQEGDELRIKTNHNHTGTVYLAADAVGLREMRPHVQWHFGTDFKQPVDASWGSQVEWRDNNSQPNY